MGSFYLAIMPDTCLMKGTDQFTVRINNICTGKEKT